LEVFYKIQDGSVNFTDVPLYQLPLQCPIPVISAMQGHGIGGGFVLGLFADFIIFSRESRYTTNFMQYGFTPGMGATYIVPEKLGVVLGHEMLFTANRYRGVDLEKRGLSIPILPRTEVLAHAINLARNLCAKPRLSLVTLKSHLVREHRERIPEITEQEVKMHDITFHQREVVEKIQQDYGTLP
jgi:polyketide biosynthesis enoyl-CoA hydratase PksI